MAKAATKKFIKVPTKKKVTVTRAKVKSIDLQYNGPEPLEVTEDNYIQALNWYTYQYENDQAREWLLEYLKKNSTKETLQAVRKAPKWAIPTTIGWQARIMMNGNVLSEKSMEFFNDRLKQVIDTVEVVEEATTPAEKPTVSIQERTKAKIDQLLAECEEAVDQDPNLNIYEWLKGKEASTQAATAICDYYAKWIKDFEYEDPSYTRQQKKYNSEQLKYWTQFVYDCERYIGNKKVTKVRKPREKKTKSAVDLVKSLKFQKEFPPLKIVSVNPAEIIGCKQLWTYNTKQRKLTRYDSSGPNGIQVKGTTLTGFDVETSVTKSLRKPDTALQSLLGAGKVALRSFMSDIKTNETKPTGRINTDTILIRVIK